MRFIKITEIQKVEKLPQQAGQTEEDYKAYLSAVAGYNQFCNTLEIGNYVFLDKNYKVSVLKTVATANSYADNYNYNVVINENGFISLQKNYKHPVSWKYFNLISSYNTTDTEKKSTI